MKTDILNNNLPATILDYFYGIVKKHPDKTAIEYNDEKISYRQLNEKSNQLAHYLLHQGLKKGKTVNIVLQRSIHTIISIFAALKCGAIYVPIDPAYPVERIKFMAEDSDALFLITSAAFKGLFITPAKEIIIESILKEIEPTPAYTPDVPIDAEDVMYILYTSGSTGKPKGTLICHRNIISFLKGIQNIFKVNESYRMLSVASVSFDASCGDYYLALTNGLTIVLANTEVVKDGKKLQSLIRSEKIDILRATPSTYKLLIDSGWQEQLPVTLLSGGEQLTPFMAQNLLGKCKSLHNMYGPTETTVNVTQAKITSIDDITIGQPFFNTPVYILDENLNPVPEGQPGELFVGGDNVGLGYFKRPELTAEKFLPDPFAQQPGKKMYRTGDLVKYDAQRKIVFLGRLDNQVKIRGYRIELGEIEQLLLEQSNVKECIVRAKENHVQDKVLVAYVVLKNREESVNDSLLINQWRKELAVSLPPFMIPVYFFVLDKWPLLPNGKIDNGALPPLPTSRPDLNNIYRAPQTAMELAFAGVWSEVLGLSGIGVDDNFFELGGNSLLAQKTVSTIKEKLQYDIPITRLYQHPTIASLQQFLSGHKKQKKFFTKKNTNTAINTDVAVIGMECNFPQATTVAAFWELLKSGTEAITFFKDNEIDASIADEIKNDANYVKARGILTDAALFDAAFFGINPRQAEVMDPQHRLFLMAARNLLEKTGYLPEKNNSITGIFAGCSTNMYFSNNVVWRRDIMEQQGRFGIVSSSDKDYISTRAAYQLNLEGPAVSVNSACSTSLLAVAEAVKSLRAGECDVAIAGGAAVQAPVNSGHIYQEGAIYSKDGHTRTFDADAHGTVFSDGVGAVLLKSLDKAKEDGDTIYAVIKGIGINNDGGNKGSFSAPSAEGQSVAIAMAINDAGISASDIAYIEAHGTATPLGDPIEIEGLIMGFGEQEKKQYCAIGSVKSNMGHMIHAAGVAGLMKTALSLHYKKIPPSINFNKPNPVIDFENSPFIINDKLINWESDTKRIAGVSSFGVGGTNVHVVMEEYVSEKLPTIESNTTPQLLTWSARTTESLNAYAQKLATFIEAHPDINIADVAYTLQKTRQEFAVRNAIVATDGKDLLQQLQQKEKLAAQATQIVAKGIGVVFMFPGQGSQYINMGKELYRQEPVYKEAVDACAQILQTEIGEDIRQIIFTENDETAAAEKLKNTYYTQPAIFVVSYALAKLYMSWGIMPQAMVGHSVGEFVAAHLSGIFSLEDVLKIIAKRARMISELPGGAMLSVRAAAESIKNMLPGDVSIAANNAPNLCVVSGSYEAVDSFAKKLEAEHIICKLLRTSHAFHSGMMDAVVAPLQAVIEKAGISIPKIPILSTVTAGWMKDEEAKDPFYWAQHARAMVNFSDAIKVIEDAQHPVFLELGPGISATMLAKQHGNAISSRVVAALDTSSKPEGELISVKKSIGKIWQLGIEINWNLQYGKQQRIILHDLPTYAYEKKRFWIEPPATYNIAANLQQAAFENTALNENSLRNQPQENNTIMRKEILINKIKEVFETASGIDIANASAYSNFTELGLDSLLLTQIASNVKKEFKLPVTFRQLNEEYDTLDKLAAFLDANLPAEAYKPVSAQAFSQASAQFAPQVPTVSNMQTSIPAFNPSAVTGQANPALGLIAQQLNILAQQVALMQGSVPQAVAVNTQQKIIEPAKKEELTNEEKIEMKKPFGATARIETKAIGITDQQKKYLENFIEKYNRKTIKSKNYTQENRAHMADPRVVSGFKPLTKEMVYSLVVKQSKGCHLWDIDGNEYVDALNGFGSNFMGYQHEVLKKAILEQIEKGYEIGPQHELAAEVTKLVCEFTGMDRAGLCNTGSEAVLGAMRIARTVTNKNTIVLFSGFYHGINDEVLVRGTKNLRTFPAASGILKDNVQNILILEYGADESLEIIKERAHEIAAVLVEPVQSRRPEFVPVAFLKKLRTVTAENDVVLIFDEVITGFRSHPGGAQALFGVKADIATYGKVVGGGISIGIIAGKKKYMDALDGGYWQYGDESVPETGVTYFAGTFVRHPLALATSLASLKFFKEQGPALQEAMNAKCEQLAQRLNMVCLNYKIPVFVSNFSSLWKIKFKEEYAYHEMLFALMRYKNVHILDGFPCYLTLAHTQEDLDTIVNVFEESVAELCKIGFIPQTETITQNGAEMLDNETPPIPGARLGKDKNGNPAWFIQDVKNPGKYLQIDI